MAQRLMVRILAALLLLSASAGGAEPYSPKLDDIEATPAATAPAAGPPARAIPAHMTICIDHTQRECWSTADHCRTTTHPRGENYRTVTTSDGAALATTLTRCWAELRR